MATLYPDWDTYTPQVRALESYVKAHPDEAYAHFLLAYHYLVVGSMDQAIAQLKEVVRLDPKASFDLPPQSVGFTAKLAPSNAKNSTCFIMVSPFA